MGYQGSMNEHITIIEGLAEMIRRTMSSKKDVQALDKKVQALDTKVMEGFDRIEHLLLAQQEQRLTDLEVRMKKLEDALAVQHQMYQRPQSPDYHARGLFFP
jgi:hypothetical protein